MPIQESSIMEKQRGKDDYFIQMEIFMLVTGRTTRLMAMENILQATELYMKGNGKMI